MKKIIYVFSLLVFPFLGVSSAADFSYDKTDLSEKFSYINEISDFVDQSGVTYSELSSNPLFTGNIELTNSINVKPNLKFGELDWGAFAWGFCCFPVGIFAVLINDKKDIKSKESFLAGWGASMIASSLAYGGLYAYVIFSSGFYYY